MSLDEICNIDVQSICEKDSCLFLWATTPLLPEALQVLDSWGFKYKTAIYWHKIGSFGLGYWFKGQVEVCLLGVRGNLKAFMSNIPNFIESKKGKHSQKPYEFYTIIESLNIDPKIELFARHHREGWDVYGNEVPEKTQRLLKYW